MTRTDVMASSRPQAVDATAKGRRPAGLLRRLAAVPAVLLIATALVAPTTALAAGEATSGYEQKPNTPSTSTTTTTPAPATETSPSKEETKPTSTETSPTKSTSPTTTSPKAAGTLPFTGFDLRWSLGLGLLLMGAGFSIVALQRRQRRQDAR
jgi:hypothetical protein